MKQTEILTHAAHVNGWEPAVYMSCVSQNFRLFHVSNLSIRNFRVVLLMYPGSVSGERRRRRGGGDAPSSARHTWRSWHLEADGDRARHGGQRCWFLWCHAKCPGNSYNSRAPARWCWLKHCRGAGDASMSFSGVAIFVERKKSVAGKKS